MSYYRSDYMDALADQFYWVHMSYHRSDYTNLLADVLADLSLENAYVLK